MKRFFGLFKKCFGRCALESEDEEDETPILEKRQRRKEFNSKRPPRFPKDTKETIPAATLRPTSPFDTRLKLLGQKIEAEVSKDYCSSQKSMLGDAPSSELSSWASNALLSSVDSISTKESMVRTAVEFPSLELLEADCYRTLVEEETIAAGPVCFRIPSYSSSAPSLSPRDCPHHQYLFYEDEEDVVMEFLPSLHEIRQVC